jgi:hypothetical protein
LSTVRELAAATRLYWPPSDAGLEATARLLGELGEHDWVRLDQVVARPLIEEAFKELSARPVSSTCVCEGWGCRRCLTAPGGLPRALVLLKEALGA